MPSTATKARTPKAKAAKRFAVIDCNNFYVSCERLFQPSLKGKPMVVLSNNDGCIISRSDEAKALGLRMTDPYFKARPLIEKHGVKVFSSNYTLYGDMSRRVMECLRQMNPAIEIYSIDEAFLEESGEVGRADLEHSFQTMRQRVLQWTGIPTSIGVAPTKTLAKLANGIAKKRAKKGGYEKDKTSGVYCLLEPDEIQDALHDLPLKSLWGINDASAKRLHQVGIHTAGELAEQSDSWLRSELSINAVRVAMELRGVPCHQLDAAPRQQKSVASTRSFGRPLIALDKLEEATASYAARAAEKLRRNKQVAGALQVFVHTNQHKKSDPQYSNAVTVQLEQPTNNTTVLITKAREATRRVFRQGYKYKKSGVILLDLSPQQHRQTDLFSGGEEQLDKKEHLMELVDSLNAKLGRHHVRVASTGLRREWSMRSEHRTPSYTTNWNDLPRAV